MKELEITWKRLVPVAWLITWRYFVMAILVGYAGTLLIDALATPLGASDLAILFMAGIYTQIVFLFSMTLAVRMALKKQYSDFQLALVPLSPDAKLN